ncbi:MAG TPA: 4-hydroxybenzoate octaprenyltransferase [Flavobacteriales bacterium]|nr:4-hydroxybenzoate octaprenyltransferase [Flavobacteriales bacterium]HIK63126.1 4-hydroxybenzoate octaprenyltransferase [Flavobacteriales bacterium]
MRKYLSLIKFSHTIFAIPFAFIGFFLATQNYAFEWVTLFYVVLCMIFARSAAMAFNRYIDRDIDTANPRTTKVREIPNGSIKAKSALIFVLLNCFLFIGTTYLINSLCLALSPIALLIILGYSYTKRFTSLCHLILGLGLALAPIGAYLAVSDTFDLLPVLFSVVVLFWVSGFDIIYSLQDEEFDKTQKLHSIPVLLGKKNALNLAKLLHFVTIILLSQIGNYPEFGKFYWIGFSIFSALLIYQHTLVKHNDLSKVNLAFFTTNGIASIIFGTFVIADILLK